MEEAINNLENGRDCKGYMKNKKFVDDSSMLVRFIDDLDDMYKR